MASSAKIMIVDDDPVLRMVAGEILRQNGYETHEAEDGDVALGRLAEESFDLVVVDMLMPNKEGIETIREIKARWPETRLVAISGGGKGLKTGYLLSVAKTFGADAVYEKPLRASGFLDIVGEALSSAASGIAACGLSVSGRAAG